MGGWSFRGATRRRDSVGEIQARLRPGKDDAIAEWLEAQENKSAAIRRALRSHIRREGGQREETVALIAEAVVGRMVRAMPEALEAAVRAAVAAELSNLQRVVDSAVREALVGRELKVETDQPAGEDPELAAQVDRQLNAFFDER
jgi:hypothetical protein